MAAQEEFRREWFEKDYYAILGVAKNATHDEIKKTYRKLAQRYHPDANPGNADAEERFKAVSGAYDVLGDEEKRKAYDRVREMGAGGFGGFPGGGAGGQGFPGGGFRGAQQVDLGDLGDLFGGMFGGGGGRRAGRQQPRRGADLETELRLGFEDAMAGVTVPVTLTGPSACATCRGSGAAPGTQPAGCPNCGGSGQVQTNQGLFSIAQTCPRCHGGGRIVETPCPACHGSGSQRRTRTFQVKVPAGVKDGARIRLAGKGEHAGPGVSAGDLYVRVHVARHPVFGRKGDDLTLSLPLTFPEAALGAKVQVPTLDGPVTLKVPAGTPGGKTFRVKSRGAPRKGGHGDLLVTVRVDVPEKLSRKEKELIEQLRDEGKESPRRSLGVA